MKIHYQLQIISLLGRISLSSSILIILLSTLCLHLSPTYAAFDYSKPIQKSVSTQASVTVQPSIAISLDPLVNMTVIPNFDGAIVSSNATLQVATNSTDGFRILLGAVGGNTNLNSTDPNNINKIASTTNATPLANFSDNTWGYYFGQSAPDTNSFFQPIPAENTEINNTNTSDETQIFNLAFGTKVTPTLPADKYSGAIIVSVIANPVDKRNIRDIQYMQDITPAICSRTPYGRDGENNLIDNRDNTQYRIRRLPDGNCWMLDDLRFKLSKDKTLTPNDTNISSNWTPLYDTQDISSGEVTLDLTTGSPNPESRNISLGRGSEVWYQIGAAENVCPKGWSLPEASNNFYPDPGSTSYGNLLSYYANGQSSNITITNISQSELIEQTGLIDGLGYATFERRSNTQYIARVSSVGITSGRFASNMNVLARKSMGGIVYALQDIYINYPVLASVHTTTQTTRHLVYAA